ncbi:hypothetical protein G0Q06_13045 [Puniceicoccales bacterium CK1056]|uniref:Insecticide toxin TcdB middle/N-terminal domain-containing protein n=1 Tax=Oceanipulchritudo coccoides TaxID=2706888 RepID=A0A6B2M6F5_9BACT|nr:RHS repeat-associated core domain-containing protein [Oceanipulchritudo coccoides]NDV63385.1 hypothetical protein [Oceanipulchritudo coccoides]
MKQFLRILTLGICAGTTLQAVDLAGTLPGEVVVDNQGAATYAIPIEVIPGTGGMQPDLKFLYSTQSGNGTMGVGWSIAGLSQITRTGKNLFFDGVQSGVQVSWGDVDRFTLDGQRLIDVDSDNVYWDPDGQDVTGDPHEYRTAVDNFARVKAIGGLGSGPSYLEVQTKDGLKMYYGYDPDYLTNSNNSRVIFSNPAGDPTAYTWLLSRVEDTLGNYMIFHYGTYYGTNVPVIRYIDYTGNVNTGLLPDNRVEFTYVKDVRPDRTPVYVLGNKIQLDGHLDKVLVQENLRSGTATTKWRYIPQYKTITAGESPLWKMESVAYSYWGSSGLEELPATEVEWFGDNASVTKSDINLTGASYAPPWTDPSDRKRLTTMVDLDADGVAELLNVYVDGNYLHSDIYSLSDGELTLLDAFAEYFTHTLYEAEFVLGDFNGDSRFELYARLTDMYVSGHSPTYDNFFRLIQLDVEGQSVIHSLPWKLKSGSLDHKSFYAGDWDGDGKDEIYGFYGDESDKKLDILIYTDPYSVIDSDGDGFMDFVQILDAGNGEYPPGYDQDGFDIRDLNHDGRDDVVLSEIYGRREVLLIRNEAVSGDPDRYVDYARFLHQNGNPVLDDTEDGTAYHVDWNQDGWVDFIDLEKSNNETWLEVYLNTGKRISDLQASWHEDGYAFENDKYIDVKIHDSFSKYGKAIFFDYDGDGFQDVGYLPKDTVSGSDTTKIKIYRNLGNSVSYVGEYILYSTPSDGDGYYEYNQFSGFDSNNDGCNGIISFRRLNGDLELAISDFIGPLQNRVKTITNGLGERTEINYAPLTDSTVYDSGHELGYPFQTVVGPAFVTSSVLKDTGLRDTNGDPVLHESWFMYAEGRSHMRGLGFLGFEQFMSYDKQRKISKIEIVEQAFPMTGLVKYTATHYWGNGPTVRDENNPPPLSERSASSSYNRFILTEVESTVICDAVTGGTMFPMITDSTEKSWEWDDQRLPDAFNSAQTVKRYEATVSEVKQVTTQTWFDSQSVHTNPVTVLPGAIAVDSSDLQDWVTQAVGLGDEDYDTEQAQFPSEIQYGNATKTFIDYHSDGMSTATVSEYHNWTASGQWLLGRVNKTTATHKKSGYPDSTKVAKVGYNTTTGLIEWEMNAFGADVNAATLQTAGADPSTNGTQYERDAFGNILKEWKWGRFELLNGDPDTWGAYSSRQVVEREMDDSNFRFVVKEYGPMSLQNGKAFYTEYADFTPRGKPKTVTDVNGGVSTITYDGLGRELTVDAPFTAADSAIETIDLTATPIIINELMIGSVTYPKQTAVMAIVEKVASGTGAQVAAVSYVDVLGRTVLERKGLYGSSTTPAEAAANTTSADRYAFKASFYNADGLQIATTDWSEDINLSGNVVTGLDSTYIIWANNSYDELGRPSIIEAGNGNRTTYSYEGLKTVVTVNENTGSSDSQYNQVSNIVKDAKGREVKTTRVDGAKLYDVINHYDAFGELVKIDRSYPNATTVSTLFEFDPLGFKEKMDDPSTGEWVYRHNFLGELLYQKDAKGNETWLEYDNSGNMIKRNRNGDITEFNYNWVERSGGFKQIGVLDNEKQLHEPYVERYYSYEGNGLMDLEWAAIDGKWFYKTYGYDNYRRLTHEGSFWKADGDADYSLAGNWHPYIVQTDYDASGYVTAVWGEDTAPGYSVLGATLWWSVHTDANPEVYAYDDRDRVDAFDLGTDLITTKLTYDNSDATIHKIDTQRNGQMGADDLILQQSEFEFDQMGRLTYRQEKEQTLQGALPIWGDERREEFVYDSLNRVTHHEIFINSVSSSLQSVATYDDFSNVLTHAFQPEGGTLSYSHGQDPTRLTGSGGFGVAHDENGNIKSQYRSSLGGWVHYKWNSFNKLATIRGEGTGDQIDFKYGTQDSRVAQFRQKAGSYLEKKLYLMGFEQSYENTGTSSVDWTLDYTRIFISTPTGVAGVYEWPGENSGAPTPLDGHRRYFHYDHQGSVVLVTDEIGDVVSRFSYDVFGGSRDALTWDRDLSDSVVDHEIAGDSGYTGHEMLADFDLIHMGGRVYDPQLARFLTPDPVVQAPTNIQNYHRYSYTLNNPLSYTDPSGYWFALIPALLKAAGVLTLTEAIVATIVVTFAGTLAMGGSASDAFKAALISGASMVVAHFIGGHFDNLYNGAELYSDPLIEMGRALAHGITSGGFSELGGGDFESGFLAGFAGSLGGSVMKLNSGNGEIFESMEARVIGAAIVGGTASELGGGKFINGAVTGAIIQVFNHEEADGAQGRDVETDGIRIRLSTSTEKVELERYLDGKWITLDDSDAAVRALNALSGVGDAGDIGSNLPNSGASMRALSKALSRAGGVIGPYTMAKDLVVYRNIEVRIYAVTTKETWLTLSLTDGISINPVYSTRTVRETVPVREFASRQSLWRQFGNTPSTLPANYFD